MRSPPNNKTFDTTAGELAKLLKTRTWEAWAVLRFLARTGQAWRIGFRPHPHAGKPISVWRVNKLINLHKVEVADDA